MGADVIVHRKSHTVNGNAMSQEVISKFLIHDGEVFPTDDSVILEKMKHRSIYEVIRVITGVPLYLEAHLARMKESALLCGFQLHITQQEFALQIQKLITINKIYNKNVKILLSANGQSYYMFFVKSSYPSDKMKSEGVHTVLYHVERSNPNAKVNNYELRAKITEYRQAHGAYEALLVDKEGMITEGSRSNIFFVHQNRFYTPPHQAVLIGITRTKVIDLCQKLDIDVVEAQVDSKQLAHFNGAFMTSTSNNILPINSVEEVNYASATHVLIKRLTKAFADDISAYVKAHPSL